MGGLCGKPKPELTLGQLVVASTHRAAAGSQRTSSLQGHGLGSLRHGKAFGPGTDSKWSDDEALQQDNLGDIQTSSAKRPDRPQGVRSDDLSTLKFKQKEGLQEEGKKFDALTKLCSTVCKAPMTCVSDRYSDQPWIALSHQAACSTSTASTAQTNSSCLHRAPFRDTPFCTWTLQQPPMAPLLVEDTLLDERFSSSPHVVSAPYIRFYAGIPLVSPDGTALGALCIMDSKPAAQCPLPATARAALLANFVNMAYRELVREQVLAAQQVAGDALLAERNRLLHLMDTVGHGTAVMLIEISPGESMRRRSSCAEEYMSDLLLVRMSCSPPQSSSHCSQGAAVASPPQWRVVCVNEAWEASIGHLNARVASHNFWALSRAQGDEAAAEKVRKACVLAVTGQLSFSATLQVGSGADGKGEPLTLRLLFNCAKRNHDGLHSSSTTATQDQPSVSTSGPTTSPFYYFISVASASNPIIPAPREGHSNGHILCSAGLTLLQDRSSTAACRSSARSSRSQRLEDRSAPLMDEGMNLTRDLQIESLLGHGSFGRVYKGRYGGQPVAIKVLQCTSEQAGGHELEALLPTHIEHPNVLRTYKHCTRPLQESRDSAGTDSGSDNMVETWMLMEYAEHGSLSDAAARGWFHGGAGRGQGPGARGSSRLGGSLSEDADLSLVLDTARDVASAMCHLHSLDILHGDLTGSNILLCSATDEEDNRRIVAKVADFGLSRILASDRIRTKTYGAVSHTPPELLLSGSLSKAVDVYAFGVILWEMLTGQQPYGGLTQPQIINHISNGRSLDIRSDWPSGLQKLMAACLSAKPGKRPSFLQLLLQLSALQEEVC